MLTVILYILTVEDLHWNDLSKNVFSLSWLICIYIYIYIKYMKYVYIYNI